MTWTHEDGGPRRLQTVEGVLGAAAGLGVTTRFAPGATMVVLGDSAYLLRAGGGDRATAYVERIDPVTLDVLASSPELAGGPAWPGGIGVAADGCVHVVFGNHAHRLDGDLQPVASRELPAPRPYNGFVRLADGHLVTKDHGGSLPSRPVAAAERPPCELAVLDPDSLEIVDRCVLPEASIARLSADADTVYVVGDSSLFRLEWDGSRLRRDLDWSGRYRTETGQGFGWDCVLAGGYAWFLDDGDGTERFDGTLRGHGLATEPLHLVRVDLATAEVETVEVCGQRHGLVANPPLVDLGRGIAVGYDSGNGVMSGFSVDGLRPLWRREQDHGGHMILYEDSGELVTGDQADVVVLDIASGAELARADTGSGMQSVLFPCPAAGRAFYTCTFLSVTRVAAAV